MKQENNYPVQVFCRVFEVSRSSYYAWKNRGPSTRSQRDEELKKEIREIYHKSFETYGSSRVYDQLIKRGEVIPDWHAACHNKQYNPEDNIWDEAVHECSEDAIRRFREDK